VNNLPSRIADIWDSNNLNWNNDLVNLIFEREAVDSIKKVRPVLSNDDDKIIWKPAKNGTCTASSAFHYLNNLSSFQLPQQGPRSISPENLNTLRRVWKSKEINPLIKTFIWRLIRRAIASGVRANSLTDKIDRNCALCGSTESDAHLFFHCDFARAVWFSAKTPLLTHTLPQEEDGIQCCLEKIIDSRTSEDTLVQVMNYLWFIWKARNDFRFRKRKWSILQVHLAVQEHMHSFKATLLSEQFQSSTKAKTPKKVPKNPQNLSICRNEENSEGFNCYTDASIDPDVSIDTPKTAGLGIVIQDSNIKVSHHIQIRIDNITSVVMAEAAAIAFAAAITSELELEKICFHTDNEMLANSINGADCPWMPPWDSKPFTQMFINHTKDRNIQVLKIPRSENSIAHKLARSAYFNAGTSSKIAFLCNNVKHVNSCPLRLALYNVKWDSIPSIAALCC
jgi:hypothetical protein